MRARFVIGWLLMGLASAQERVVLRTSTILDGKGGILRNQDLLIEGSKIQSMSAGPIKGYPVYDLRGLTLMPGWIDTHVHLDWYFDKDHKLANRSKETPQSTAVHAAENAWVTLLGGFTTVQSVGSPMDIEIRDRIQEGSLPGPRVLTSYRQINEQSGDPEAIRALVRKTKADGADVIKLFATKGLGAGGAQSMSDAQLEAACGEAKAQGFRAVVHAISAGGAKAAILAGCTAIEHGDFVDGETLDLMAARGVYFDPNFLVLHNYLDLRSSFSFTPEAFESLRKALEPTAQVLREARRHKVKVVFGTDAVAGAHGRNAEEFVYRVREGGDAPMDAIVSATSLAAESLGLKEQLGSIAPGMAADLVATQGNPLEQIESVRKVVFVMKGGRIFKNTIAGK